MPHEQKTRDAHPTKKEYLLSLMASSISALSVLILTFIEPNDSIFGNIEFTIMGMGILLGILGLLVGQVIEKYFPESKVGEDI